MKIKIKGTVEFTITGADRIKRMSDDSDYSLFLLEVLASPKNKPRIVAKVDGKKMEIGRLKVSHVCIEGDRL